VELINGRTKRGIAKRPNSYRFKHTRDRVNWNDVQR